MAAKPERRVLEADDTRLDVMRYFRLVWRRRLFVVLPVLFLTSITGVAVRYMSPLFVSQARLLVEQRTRVNNELEHEIISEDKRIRRKDQLSDVRTQIEGREFLESVIRELGLQNDPTILARAKIMHDTRNPDVPTEEIAMRLLIRGLREKLDVKVADNNMFTVAISDNDAESAYILAKVIARDFVTEVKRERMDKLEELFKFSSAQQRIYSDKVDGAEKDLRDFQSKLIREQNTGGTVNVANVTAAKGELRRMQSDLEQGDHRADNLRDLLRSVLDALPDVKVLRADKEVAALERRLRSGVEDDLAAEVQRSPGAANTTLDANGTTRSALRARLSALADDKFAKVDAFYRERIAEYAYETIANDVLRSVANDLDRQLTRYSSRAEAQPELELQLTALQEKAAQARTDLETFERTVKSAELSETMMATELAGGVSVVDPPEKPVAPVKPDKKRLTILAFVLSLLGGVGSILGLEYLDKSFKDVEEIERVLNLRVVGTVPRVPNGMPFGGIPASRRRHLVLASSILLLVMVIGGMALYEKLLRKQHVTVPRARAEEILRGGVMPSAAVRPSANTVRPASVPDANAPATSR